ncbi:uncharacterized protein Tco025E_06041 [Trypanosoma conorhini]|uniref:Uncharacterized protein n=1 Tax=Trypanosoma conorhini TaxID=83891 RepID=A0A3R7N735_9TRYP|nr:uncharacterized protein Tco025E_06041 [Trypanosoma conorhini]RNF13884.1 hypothetical protein Tco025E_06041 [Trypanosoma conorhini]
MPTPATEGFLVRLSQFDARSIDAARHPPPYVLRGRLPDSNFVCDASPVPGAPSWACRHTFACAAREPQLVLECYGSNGESFVGMCAVQTPQLLEAAAAFDAVVTLQLRDGHFVTGEIAFPAVVEALHLLTVDVARLAVLPPPLPGATVYVELSCVGGEEEEGEGGDAAASVTSARVATEVAAWASLPPLPPCRRTLGALARQTLAGTLCGDADEPLGRFRVPVPAPVVQAITAAAAAAEPPVAAAAAAAAAATRTFRFDFDVPVETTREGAPLRCTGGVTLSLGAAPPAAAHSSASTSSASAEDRPAEDLRVLAEVLEQQQRMLGTVRGQLDWVRNYKATIRRRLESLRQQPAAADPRDTGIRARIEQELQDAVLRREQLRDELAALQQRRAAATAEHALRVAGHARSQEELEEEQAKLQFRREGVRRLQLEMQAYARLEGQRERQRLRQSEEQQQLNSSDAATLVEVMRLLERRT